MDSLIVGWLRAAGLLIAAGTLAACGDATPPPAAPAPQAVLSPELATTYQHTCANCHTNPQTGAPQAGDAKAWAPRLAQGQDVLLDHAINGYKGMPPLGTCMDCTREQFQALIDYMAGVPQAGKH
ncbi:MAG TPA: c-type cytochrome [Rhodanobacter sp.]|nr:c-type cytochrome [Rhodanobacter sp.]